MIGLIPGEVPKPETTRKVSIDSIEFVYEENRIELNLCLTKLNVESEIIITLSSFDLVEDTSEVYDYEFKASSDMLKIKIPIIKSKTLFEIVIFQSLYPDQYNSYNFILQSLDNQIENSHSYNPLQIDFKNDKTIYEEFEINNSTSIQKYSLLERKELPYFENDMEVKDVEVWIDLICVNKERKDNFYKLGSKYQDGHIVIIDSTYFDWINNRVVFDKGFKVENINFPVQEFNVIVKFSGVGATKSNIVIEQKYVNERKILGDCREAVFCFQ